jgi:Holliday junction DNA helicase RuvB
MNEKSKNKKQDIMEELDPELENSLRPHTFSQVIGREKEKKNLEIMIKAAKKRGEALDHVLFYGPPGLGKTTLAHVVANELKAQLFATSGPAIERQGDLASIITNIPKGGILFIDEIHRLNKAVEEILYPAMEDNVIDIVIGKGPSAKTLRLDLEDFGIIGATTRIGLISSPLRNRFGASFRLDFYESEELRLLVLQKADILKVAIDEEAALEIARRSRGTARIAIRHLKRVRDYVQVDNIDKITLKAVEKVLQMHDVDSHGLEFVDRRILELIARDFEGGPVGLSTLAAALSEEVSTIADVYEPFLLQEGFLKRTSRGRVVTAKGYKHLGLKKAKKKEQSKLL